MTICCEAAASHISAIKPLMEQYKRSIGEIPLDEDQYKVLYQAVCDGSIHFFVARDGGNIVGMCSVSRIFSTFSCSYGGVFEDFYIVPAYREKGIARELAKYVFEWCEKNEVLSLWVGCADCDIEMYQSLGFQMPLGNLLAWVTD